MEITGQKQTEKALKRPKRSKNEAKNARQLFGSIAPSPGGALKKREKRRKTEKKRENASFEFDQKRV